ncbi:hypothetical protein J2T17_003246 [Paenibacillus mucilaginosus]|uniref:sugar-binding domain-containing protein n=1 Tax=Paenibacillus mucilaginosus TaxID=61624 RepID=UPI003D1E4B0F
MRLGKILRRWILMLLVAALVIPVLPAAVPPVYAEETYVPPENGRVVYNFNLDWKFYQGDVTGAEAAAFDDFAWETVSAPHTYNDVDSYDEYITHDGEANLYRGIAWYRKHFKLPAEQAGQKVFIEFEGIRQAAYLFVNGQNVCEFRGRRQCDRREER